MRLSRLPALSLLALGLAAAPTPAQTDRAGWFTELETMAHGVRGVVSIVDQDTIRVDNFYYDGLGISVYFYLATEETNQAFQNGLQIGNELVGTVYSNDSLVIDLPAGETIDGYEAVSVWCVTAGANFGSGSFHYPRAGWQAELSTNSHDVDGIVTIVDENTVRADPFYYDGLGVEVYFYLGTQDSKTAFQNGLQIGPDLLGMPFNGGSIEVDLPAGEDLDGWNAISVWCTAASANFGSGTFAPVFEIELEQLRAGTASMLESRGGSAEGVVVAGYSITGSGPTMTSIGLVDLSPPIQRLPNMVANVAGSAQQRVITPSGTQGTPVWLQAYDVKSGRLSNGLMQVIQ